MVRFLNNISTKIRREAEMVGNIKVAILLLPLKEYKCAACKEQKANGQCPRCQAMLCRPCWKTHRVFCKPPLLNAINCVICGNEPDSTCSFHTCRAPLCQNWGCREKHENEHRDARSDEDKERNP